MVVEQEFAAAVLNAAGMAKIANTVGHSQSASDQIAGALAELWEAGRKVGMAGAEIQAIADRHIHWDNDGEPWPRPMGSNVVAFRR